MEKKKTAAPKISIIILNWNLYKESIECLETLLKNDYPNFEVLLIDNGSSNESVTELEKWFSTQKKLHVLNVASSELKSKTFWTKKKKFNEVKSSSKILFVRHDKNEGFGAGCNVLLDIVTTENLSDYVLFLNNDLIVKADFLSELLATAKRHKGAGIISSKIYYYDVKGRKDILWYAGGFKTFSKLWCAGPPFGMNKEDAPEFNEEQELELAVGTSMLLDCKLLKEYGGKYDEGYFIYNEESDLCLFAKEKGYSIWYSPKSVVWHKVHQSSGGKISPIVTYYLTRNQLLMAKKYNGTLKTLLLFTRMATYSHTIKAAKFAKAKKLPLMKYYYRALWDGLRGKKFKGH
ncbi:glycosyltransferase family 2 protein [Candidatus Woesearchaeota archaeon]|nr:glycosyltransferase family 2 protein [Nanoarchaeota archaeon]MCB9371093.1 glycosyltransferase family 2 protein [Candidatus Woesearchaeota archaeon]USN44190.1 MAG: glycosyltransferase family 2 protein [Candidatus Woesearchaeota archaeon]